MNFDDCTVNIIPVKINKNFEEDISSWKVNKSSVASSTQKAIGEQNLLTEVEEDKFIKLYKDLPNMKTYFLGRKFYGEQVPINDNYQVCFFESTKEIDHETMKDQKVLKRITCQLQDSTSNDEITNNNKLMVWEHEKLPSDSYRIDGNFQNQWYDINEMIKINELIHE